MDESSIKTGIENRDIDIAYNDLIVSLTILEKNIGLYPLGHTAIRHSSARSFKLLQDIFISVQSITLVVVKNMLIVNDHKIETINSRITDFALSLSQRGIVTLTLKNGLSEDELQCFYHLVLTIPPKSHIHNHKNILEEINSLPHVSVKEIDLSGIQFVNRETLSVQDQLEQPKSMWEKLLFGGLPAEHLGLPDTLWMNGRSNNSFQTDSMPLERITEGYEAVLKDLFHDPVGQANPLADKHEFFSALLEVLPEFKPELKEQILSITFDNINDTREEESLEGLMACMPSDMIVAVLDQAKRKNREISPTLMKLLGALSRKWKQSPEKDDAPAHHNDMTLGQIQKLIERELYENYVSEEYGDELHYISLGANASLSGTGMTFPIEEHIKTLQDNTINRLLISAMLGLMDGDLDEQAYIDFAGKTKQLVLDLLLVGEYEILGTAYGVLLNQASDKKDPGARTAANDALKVFSSARFISTLSNDFSSQIGRSNRAFEELIVKSGEKNLPWLLDLYTEQIESFNDRLTYDLIIRFGPYAALEALKRVSDADNAVLTIALLKLIQTCGDNHSVMQTRSLLESSHIEVRIEVIKMILRANDRTAVTALENLLHSRDDQTVAQAFTIIRDYSVNELSLELVSMIRTGCISKKTLARNKAVLNLLGTLGDVNVLPAFHKIAFARFSFTPLNLKQTQQFLYGTLGGYPPISIEKLLQRGLRKKWWT